MSCQLEVPAPADNGCVRIFPTSSPDFVAEKSSLKMWRND